jgi:hypothetical protein
VIAELKGRERGGYVVLAERVGFDTRVSWR